MGFGKKTTALCAFAVGTILLITSALADMMIESGYQGLKASAKTTMAKLANEVDNFSVDIMGSIKADGNIFAEVNENIKYDMVNQAKESFSSGFENGQSSEYYYYSDPKIRISKSSKDDTYYVWEKNYSKKINSVESKIFTNPFDEERAADFERIVDAFVGSLQEAVQVEEVDNKKMYFGNLSDAEIPSLINAISSFVLKYSIFNDHNSKNLGFPKPKSNIYVTNLSGKAIENEHGILESIIGSASITADDENGVAHIYSVEFAIDIKDINNTVVKAPDLEGKKVEYSKSTGIGFDERYIGTYKKYIIEEEKDAFVKKGERIIEITSVDTETGQVRGRFYEIHSDGFEPEEDIKEFEFIAHDSDSNYYLTFKYYDKGEEKTGIIERSESPNIRVLFNVEISEDGNGYSHHEYNQNLDGEYIRIFE